MWALEREGTNYNSHLMQATTDGGGSISSSALHYHEGPTAETSARASRLIVNSASDIRRAILPGLQKEVKK